MLKFDVYGQIAYDNKDGHVHSDISIPLDELIGRDRKVVETQRKYLHDLLDEWIDAQGDRQPLHRLDQNGFQLMLAHEIR